MSPKTSPKSVGPLPLSQGEFAHDVLCLGLNACDHLCLVEGFPQRGGKLRIEELKVMGGGQAATAACALARLGWKTAFAGVCGDDAAGLRAEPWLRDFGVDPRGLRVLPGAGSQQAFILVEKNGGERTINWYRDEACRLAPEMVEESLVASARVLHLDGHFLEASIRAARLARERGILVSLDGERIYPGSEKLVSLCDVVMGCEDYAQRITGLSSPVKALEALSRLGPRWVGRTLGSAGAELLVRGQWLRRPGFAVRAVDTTGAGDVFHAGMVHALLLGQPPEKALDTANALAAISVTRLGGRGALADRLELERFLARTGV